MATIEPHAVHAASLDKLLYTKSAKGAKSGESFPANYADDRGYD
jgi:hypothetical protein